MVLFWKQNAEKKEKNEGTATSARARAVGVESIVGGRLGE